MKNEDLSALTEGERELFGILSYSLKLGETCLVRTRRKSTNKEVAVLCSVQFNEDDSASLTKIAVLLSEEELDDLEDPSLNKESIN